MWGSLPSLSLAIISWFWRTSAEHRNTKTLASPNFFSDRSNRSSHRHPHQHIFCIFISFYFLFRLFRRHHLLRQA
ncbi:hypothetical protein JOM56_005072 [Amanita muscaria]